MRKRQGFQTETKRLTKMQKRQGFERKAHVSEVNCAPFLFIMQYLNPRVRKKIPKNKQRGPAENIPKGTPSK